MVLILCGCTVASGSSLLGDWFGFGAEKYWVRVLLLIDWLVGPVAGVLPPCQGFHVYCCSVPSYLVTIWHYPLSSISTALAALAVPLSSEFRL